MAYIFGIYLWHISLVYIFGLYLWHPATGLKAKFILRMKIRRMGGKQQPLCCKYNYNKAFVALLTNCWAVYIMHVCYRPLSPSSPTAGRRTLPPGGTPHRYGIYMLYAGMVYGIQWWSAAPVFEGVNATECIWRRFALLQ